MNKLIKYDFKANKSFLRNIIFLQIILLGLSFIGNSFLSKSYLANPAFANGVFAITILFFVIINLIFMGKNLANDFKSNGTILKFSLPLTGSKLIWSKIIGQAIFYIVNLGLIFIFLWALKFKMTTDIIYFLVLGLIWTLICTGLVYYFLQVKRFNQAKIYNLYGILLLIAILSLGFFVCKYYSFVIVNGEIQHAGLMNYGFIFPFAVGSMGLYKNISPMIYYVIGLLLVVFINKKNLTRNVDLS